MPTKPRVLIIDDEPFILRALSQLLTQDGYEVVAADSGERGIDLAIRSPPSVVFVDMRLGGMDGLAVTRTLSQEVPNAAVIVMTGYGSVENAVEAMQAGATDYLVKPISPAQLRLVLGKTLSRVQLQQELAESNRTTHRRSALTFSSRSRAMQVVFQAIGQAAATSASLLLLGETGTGKSVLARHVHELSDRRGQPFVTVQCAVIAPSLIESELFGHKKGAFTGASRTHAGLVETADAGTLFLDEIGDLALELQGKLLRLLEEREYVRVGDTIARRSQARIVAATHHDLKKAVKAGRFREDLYYRLNVLTVRIPPLRERPEDIAELARSVADTLIRRHHRPPLDLHPDFVAALTAHSWPGNTRELVNVLERAVILAQSSPIGLDLLPEELQPIRRPAAESPLGEDSLEAAERRHLQQVLGRYPTLELAAKALGIDPSTLYRKRERHRLL